MTNESKLIPTIIEWMLEIIDIKEQIIPLPLDTDTSSGFYYEWFYKCEEYNYVNADMGTYITVEANFYLTSKINKPVAFSTTTIFDIKTQIDIRNEIDKDYIKDLFAELTYLTHSHGRAIFATKYAGTDFVEDVFPYIDKTRIKTFNMVKRISWAN